MLNTFTQTFILRKDLCKGSDVKPIHIRVFINRKKIVLTTNLKIPEVMWDSESQEIRNISKRGALRSTSTNRLINPGFEPRTIEKMNHLLVKLRSLAQDIILKAEMREEYIPPEDFKRLLSGGSAEGRKVFNEYYKRHLDIRLKNVTQGTANSLLGTYKRFNDFQRVVCDKDIDITLVDRFESYLRSKKLGANTRGKQHSNLRTFLTRACKEWKLNNPYENFKMPKAETRRDFLVTEEVGRLVDLLESEDLKPGMTSILKRYLFSCYNGGIRLSDTHLIGAEDLSDSGAMLVFTPKKTVGINKIVKVPLKNGWEKFVDNPKGDRFFDRKTGPYINRQLKKLAKLAKISKNVTFHTSRHTFATGYLAGSGTIEVLQKIMGHAKIETTQVYTHITSRRIEEEAMRVTMFL